jgi:LmbE family N-acetylglucosaminyl deacetylase
MADLAALPLVVLAPHPDDESLGCGGLLAEAWRAGGTAHVLCFTDGSASHPKSCSHPPERLRAVRETELVRAVEILGGTARDVSFMGFPDAASHLVHGPGQDAVRALGDAVDRLAPAVLLAPSPFDPHCDHVEAARASHEVAARRPGLRLVHYPVWSAWAAPDRTAPVPDGARIVLRDHDRRAEKRAAIEAHESQRGLVVADDPEGFTLPPGFADHFVETPEVFFEVHP